MFFSTSRFFLYASVFFVVIVLTSTLFPFIVGKYSWFRVCVDLALISFLLGLVWDPKAEAVKKKLGEVFRSPLFWAISAFTFIFLLAGFLGVNPSLSFWSNFERGEGGFQMLHLYAFFVMLAALFSEEKHWQKIFLFSLLAAMLVVGYGVGASLKYVDGEVRMVERAGRPVPEFTGNGGFFYKTFKSFIGPKLVEEGTRPSGSIGNPAYTAAYLIFALFYAAYLLFGIYRQFLKSPGAITLMVMMAVFLIFFYLAATRGALLGLLAAVLFAISYLVYGNKKLRIKGFILEAVILIVFVLMLLLQNNPVINKIPGSRIFDISFSAETFQHRAIMWKSAWDGFKERPLLGWGPENFINVFDEHFNTKYFNPAAGFGAWFDRAHSIIFDYLAETGILGLLSYLSIFVAFYWRFFRSKLEENSKLLNAMVFALPIAYLVQGIILFDVLTISFNLFLFLGFGYYYTRNKQLKTA